MKITAIDVFLTCPTRNYVVVKVHTDAGIYGVGEGTLNGSEPIVAEAIRHVSPLLIGRDPRNTEDLWSLIYHWGYWRGGPIYMTALAAIDMALWDIKGKIANLPVYQLLGGASRRGVLCYGHAGGRDEVEIEDSVRSFLERGYRVVRAQLGNYGGLGIVGHEPPVTEGTPPTHFFEPAKYLVSTPRFFEHLREKLGMEVDLLHDVHEQLTPIEAAWLAKQLEPYRLFFLEDALRPEHRNSWKLVREASTTPLAIGEIFSGRWDCLPLFQGGFIDYIRIKPLHVGGITEARKIMMLAEPYNVRSAFHGAADIGPIAQSASIHLQMTIPNSGVQEWTDFRKSDLLCEVFPSPCRFSDGLAVPNEAPGLGIDYNEELGARYPYKQAWMPLVRRQDGTMHVY